MQTPYQDFAQSIFDIFNDITIFFNQFQIPFGITGWIVIFTTVPLLLIIIAQVVRGRRKGENLPDGVKAIIASTGDVSAGMTGAKKLKFLKTPNDALIFLKIEENAIQQALSAIDYFAERDELDESMKDQLIAVYQGRLDSVRAAIEKDEELKSIVATDDAIDKARSDYLRKLAAMSGTTVEPDTEESGPTSVGMPSEASTAVTTQTTTPSAVPSGGAPSGGPPGSAAPSGGAPGGGPPGGAAPSGGAPSGGAPGGAAPSGGAPGGAAPSGGAPSGGPPGGAPSDGPPGGAAPSGDAPSGAPAASGKSSLQSEMLAEMERLKSLMSGD
ncbi:MAG: hypothetical protein ACTSU3_11275 [Candidatus Thorarchaeota archaeon]